MFIHFILLIISFVVFIHAHENVSNQHALPITHNKLIFNNTGCIISAPYKEYVTLPEEAWCIAENLIGEDQIKIKDMQDKNIYYENEKNIIGIYWDQKFEKKEKIVNDGELLMMLFYIRTFNSLTNGNLKTYINYEHKYFPKHPEKKLKDFVYQETLNHAHLYIFNQRIPDEILFNIITYTDYKSLFCVLACVNKTFYAFTNQLNHYCNIKKKVEIDRWHFTKMVKAILFRSASLPLAHKMLPLDIITNYPRFSRKTFFDVEKVSFEECLWKSELKIHKINDVYYLYETRDSKDTESNNRTDQEFDELLHACLSNTQQFSAEIFRKKDAYTIAKSIKKDVQHRYVTDKACRSALKDKNVLFIHIWNALYQTCINELDSNMDLEFFYDSDCLFTILVELLYKDLDTETITLNKIPFTFLECIRDIAKSLYNVPHKDLPPNKSLLRYALEKDRECCYKIIQDLTTLDGNCFKYTLNNGIILKWNTKLDDTVLFIDIWNEVYNKTYKKIINDPDINIKNYYANPFLLKILVRLLYKDLDAKKITFNQIPSTFLASIRDIAKPLCDVPHKDLPTGKSLLRYALEKDKMYFYKIVYDTHDPLLNVIDYIYIYKDISGCTTHQSITHLLQNPLLRIFSYVYYIYQNAKIHFKQLTYTIYLSLCHATSICNLNVWIWRV